MSLQSDFERCLEYAEKIESAHLQRVQAQNNIIFVQNNSNRLNSKLRISKTISTLSAVALFIVAFVVICAMIDSFSTFLLTLGEAFPLLLILSIARAVSSSIFKKTKMEIAELESQKAALIQQYTDEAEKCTQELKHLAREIYDEDLFDIVPKDYFSVGAIEFCLGQIRKKLATSATEAFQQLDAEIKRLEQMAYLEELSESQSEQLNEIKRAIDLNTLVTIAGQNKYNR